MLLKRTFKKNEDKNTNVYVGDVKDVESKPSMEILTIHALKKVQMYQKVQKKFKCTRYQENK